MQMTIKIVVKECCEEKWAKTFADVVEDHDLESLVDMVKQAATESHEIGISFVEDDLYNPRYTFLQPLGQKVQEEIPILGVVDLVPLPENVMPTKCTECGNDFTPEDKLLNAIFGEDLRNALCISCKEKDKDEPSIQVDVQPLSEYLEREE